MAGDGLGRGAERCVTGAVSARADEEVLAVDAGTAARPVRVPRGASACLGVPRGASGRERRPPQRWAWRPWASPR